MAIKAFFPTGTTSINLDALHQWDYGQILEIETEDPLPSIVEVHFSCLGMTEAEVCNCLVDTTTNTATVAIPDLCLEQTALITAWIYEIVGSEGKTTKAITIPIIARARPNRSPEVPSSATDLYTEAIANINETVEQLRNGSIPITEVEHAKTATEATHAKTADAANVSIATWAKGIFRHEGGSSIEGVGSIDMSDLPEGLYHVTVTSTQDNLNTGALIFYYTYFPSSVCLLQYPTKATSGGEFFLGINIGGEQTNRLEVFKTTTASSNGVISSTTNKITRPTLSIELVVRIA